MGQSLAAFPGWLRDSRVQKPNLEVFRNDWVSGNRKPGTTATLRCEEHGKIIIIYNKKLQQ